MSYGAGDYDIYLIKTDFNGDTLWTRTYGGILDDRGYSVQQTTDGGYIISGATSTYGSGNLDIYIIKTNINGDTLWTRTYGGILDDRGYSVQQTNDSGFIISAASKSFGSGGYDVYLIKTTNNGDSLWTKTYGGSDNDYGYSVKQTADSGFIIVGSTMSYGAGGYDIYLIKTNSIGDSLWTKTFGGASHDKGYSIQQINDRYIIAGSTNSYGAGSYDAYLIKISSNGDILWTKTFGGVDLDWVNSVQQTTDNGYIIAGRSDSYGAGGPDVYLIKTDVNGLSIEETIISTPIDFSYSIDQISYNSISLQFTLPLNDRVELNIYDAAGRYISTPISGYYSAGVHSVNFKLNNKGVYFFNLITINKITENGKFIILR